ncbi:hypothetical protein [Streptomyces sp. SM11]|uniref:hypothetical protein n=1 Tax=Streptomyces sp. SM11 TaxID=565557 RepID=UPI0015E18DAD|nr:hypothetical protein [Streptomyces sp. SM11]
MTSVTDMNGLFRRERGLLAMFAPQAAAALRVIAPERVRVGQAQCRVRRERGAGAR